MLTHVDVLTFFYTWTRWYIPTQRDSYTQVHSHMNMLTCMCAKSLQLCLTLYDATECSLPGSSVHGILPGKNTGVDCCALLQGIFTIQGSNPHLLPLLHWQAGSSPLAPPVKPECAHTRTYLHIHWNMCSHLCTLKSLTRHIHTFIQRNMLTHPYGRKWRGTKKPLDES